MTDTSKEAVKDLADTLCGKHGFAYIKTYISAAANTLRALSAQLEAVTAERDEWKGLANKMAGNLNEMTEAYLASLNASGEGYSGELIHVDDAQSLPASSIRDEALEEAAKACEDLYITPDNDREEGQHDGVTFCIESIRALKSQEAE